MITNLIVRKVATFSDQGIELKPSKINYIYGANGTGKTTISRIIENPELYPDSKIEWEGENKLTTFVYNRDFIDTNIVNSEKLKGVFTIGAEAGTAQNAIAEKRSEIVEIEKKISALDISLTEIKDQSTKNESDFTEICWIEKSKSNEYFSGAMKGHVGSKISFKQKVLDEISNNSELKDRSYLGQKVRILFKKDTIRIPVPNNIDLSELIELESNKILNTIIIGKENVDLAAMISKLRNSDWVEKGVIYLKQNDGICPFCQRQTDDQFRQQLEDYFDTSFKRSIEELHTFKIKYQQYYQRQVLHIKNIVQESNEYIENESIRQELVLIDAIYQANLMKIDKKINEPSLPQSIDSLASHLRIIEEIIDKGIRLSIKHNETLDDATEERKLISGQVWRYICNELKNDIQNYSKRKSDLKNAQENIISTRDGLLKRKRELVIEIGVLEEKISTTSFSISAINKMLNKYGFHSFALAEDSTSGFYRIVRKDGQSANRTLSEGEKTFIAFLYFHQLTLGSQLPTNVMDNRIVVYDDPVSSLDSSVLFVVGALIRSVINGVLNKQSNIQQVFLLTHNIYFHKDVTQTRYKDKNGDKKYWVLSTSDSSIKLTPHSHNPIQNSYELLWGDIRNPDLNSINSIHNTIRKIIDYYFRIIGSQNYDSILDSFEGEDKIICRSFFDWMNEGSHIPYDDVYVDDSQITRERYLGVFRDIFIKTGHDGHYKMMMRKD